MLRSTTIAPFVPFGGLALPSMFNTVSATDLQSALEMLLQQLVAARDALREESGGMVEVFNLKDYLLP